MEHSILQVILLTNKTGFSTFKKYDLERNKKCKLPKQGEENKCLIALCLSLLSPGMFMGRVTVEGVTEKVGLERVL